MQCRKVAAVEGSRGAMRKRSGEQAPFGSNIPYGCTVSDGCDSRSFILPNVSTVQ